jgi:type 1 glutamine amidotransferase
MKVSQFAGWLALTLAAWPLAAAETAAPKKILFFTKSSNFEHSVIKERNGQPSFAAKVLAELGPKHGIEFVFSKDGSRFSPEYLAQFDAIMFYTSGDLLSAGKDGNPPMSAAGKQALLDAVRNGKGFIGVHSAADTFHTDENAETNTNQPRTWRYQNRGKKADPYTQMIGGELLVHGTQQIATMQVVDPKFPGLAKRAPSFSQQEEWYSMTNFAPDMHVLLLHDTSTMRDPNANGKDWPPAGWDTPYKRPPYPSTWARMHGKGRVYFTAMGHREDTWLDPLFQEMLLGGIDWALGRVNADVTPNLAKVAPRAAELPPPSGPVAGLPSAQKQAEEKKYYSK